MPRNVNACIFWNDDDTDLGNLRTFEHWLSQKWGHASFRSAK